MGDLGGGGGGGRDRCREKMEGGRERVRERKKEKGSILRVVFTFQLKTGTHLHMSGTTGQWINTLQIHDVVL